MFLLSEELWQNEAECRKPDVQPEWFFPERGQSRKPGQETCLRCPVSGECADYRRRSGSAFGMWGGRMTPRKTG